MVKHVIYVVVTLLLFFAFAMGMEMLSMFWLALHAKITFQSYISTLVGGTLAVNVVGFALVYGLAYLFSKKPMDKQNLKKKVLLFLIMQLILMLLYVVFIFKVYLPLSNY